MRALADGRRRPANAAGAPPRQPGHPGRGGAAAVPGDPGRRRRRRRSRRAAAGWSWPQAIASKDNPLTARVIVNRVWPHHFGRGLVGTPSNFGTPRRAADAPRAARLPGRAGSSPSGWSVKALHREILLSATYQHRAAGTTPSNAAGRPGQPALWRMNRRRLEVEPWRDAMLAVAGNLDRTLGGPSRDLSVAGQPPADAVRRGQPAQPRPAAAAVRLPRPEPDQRPPGRDESCRCNSCSCSTATSWCRRRRRWRRG